MAPAKVQRVMKAIESREEADRFTAGSAAQVAKSNLVGLFQNSGGIINGCSMESKK